MSPFLVQDITWHLKEFFFLNWCSLPFSFFSFSSPFPFFFWPHGMQDLSQPGMEPVPLHWELGVLTTGWAGKSIVFFLFQSNLQTPVKH